MKIPFFIFASTLHSLKYYNANAFIPIPKTISNRQALSDSKSNTSEKSGDGSEVKHKIIFMRHGESTFNAQGRFIGWLDPPLSELGISEVKRAAEYLKQHNLNTEIDEIHVSYLKRSIKSGWLIAEELERCHIPVIADWRLNEQMYGALQGHYKREIALKHGIELTQKWRRSYETAPPAVKGASGYFPSERKYKLLGEDDIPEGWCGSALTESLKDTQARTWRLWRSVISPSVREGKTVLVCAHSNVIRAMLKRLDNIDNDTLQEDITMPRAIPLLYELNKDLVPVRREGNNGKLSGQYLADPKVVEEAFKMECKEVQLGLTKVPLLQI
mmetsp:Transcript_17837/g.26405  ORF Transcript_17837/g.26405 Transcript_17837/m.26405 type:complete len:329 (-) Transcript_17837:47-1033(-)